jgi:branched-subunit amino acid aminotransferase/4-amino-4-deoxychorismate lyase
MSVQTPSEFLLSRHYKYLEDAVPTSPGFHDVGGVYSSIALTKRGIMDLPFHIYRLYWSCIFLDYFKDSPSNRLKFVEKVLLSCDSTISVASLANGLRYEMGMMMITCGPGSSSLGETFEGGCTNLSSYFAPNSATPQSPTPFSSLPCIADVYPIQRNPPQIKYTRWTLERQPIMDHRPKEIQETLIYYHQKDGGEEADILTEGITSNFYVLADDGETLIMPPTEKILYGSVQRWIEMIAPLIGMTVKVEQIKLGDIDLWKGCFITSNGRILHKIDKIRIPVHPSSEQQLKVDSSSSTAHFSRVPYHYDDYREISFTYPDNHLVSKLVEVVTHLVHDKHHEKDNKEMKKLEKEFEERIGYNPWIYPSSPEERWNHDLLDQQLPTKILHALDIIDAVHVKW